MEHHPIRAVLFDNDGTLVDSERPTYAVLVDCLARHGIDLSLEEALEHWAGVDLRVTLRTLGERAGVTLPDDFLDVYRAEQLKALEAGVGPIDGAPEVLRSLPLPRAVVSNAPVVKMALCLRSAGLMEFLDEQHLYSAYDVGKWKPDPTVYLHAAAALGFEPKHCAVVEDSVSGVEAGRAAGMRVFALDAHGKLPGWDDVERLERLDDLLARID